MVHILVTLNVQPTLLTMPIIPAKLLEPLPTILSRALATALKPDSSEDIRSAAVSLFGCLVDPTKGVEGDPQGDVHQAGAEQPYMNAELYVALLSRHSL